VGTRSASVAGFLPKKQRNLLYWLFKSKFLNDHRRSLREGLFILTAKVEQALRAAKYASFADARLPHFGYRLLKKCRVHRGFPGRIWLR